MLVKYLISTYIYLNVFSKCVASQKKKNRKKNRKNYNCLPRIERKRLNGTVFKRKNHVFELKPS